MKNFKVDFRKNKVLSFRSKDSNVFYPGIQIVEPEIFEFLSPKFDLIDTYIHRRPVLGSQNLCYSG